MYARKLIKENSAYDPQSREFVSRQDLKNARAISINVSMVIRDDQLNKTALGPLVRILSSVLFPIVLDQYDNITCRVANLTGNFLLWSISHALDRLHAFLSSTVYFFLLFNNAIIVEIKIKKMSMNLGLVLILVGNNA